MQLDVAFEAARGGEGDRGARPGGAQVVGEQVVDDLLQPTRNGEDLPGRTALPGEPNAVFGSCGASGLDAVGQYRVEISGFGCCGGVVEAGQREQAGNHLCEAVDPAQGGVEAGTGVGTQVGFEVLQAQPQGGERGI
ncbi:hypothetical protein [Amycolatopsis vastitatis]|uniref:hypothetical protein n=1 Tax=Amycolatopsis vastitatis TaxID=1905142 RepID=UPI00142D80DB|nr:hypothetical protein [Amycolatopsis vastitatis]